MADKKPLKKEESSPTTSAAIVPPTSSHDSMNPTYSSILKSSFYADALKPRRGSLKSLRVASSEFIHTKARAEDVQSEHADDYFSKDNAKNPTGKTTSAKNKKALRKSFSGSGSLVSESLSQDGVTELEKWWLQSPIWRRMLPFMVFIIFIVGVLQLGVGIYLISSGEKKVPDPYICRTDSCEEVSNWLSQSIDIGVQPCDNFYQYVCGKYQSPVNYENTNLPKQVKMDVARLELNQDAVIAGILKTTTSDTDNEQMKQTKIKRGKKIIRYYKACLNTRARENDDLPALVDALNQILFDVFHNFSTPGLLSYLPAEVAHITGDFGTFRVKLLNYPEIVLLPPFRPPILDVIDINNENDIRTIKFAKDLLYCYTYLWPRLNITTDLHPLQARDDTIHGLRLINNITGKTRAEWRASDIDEKYANLKEDVIEIGINRTRFLISTYLFGNPDETKTKFINSSVDGMILTERDLFFIISDVQVIFKGPKGVHKGLASLWIFSLLQVFSSQLTSKTYKELKMGSLFPGTDFSQYHPIERFCFESVITRLNAMAISHLEAEDLNRYDEALKDIEEIGNRIKHVMRKFTPDLDNYLYPDQIAISKKYFGEDATVLVNSPIVRTENEARYNEIVNSYFDKFEPSDKHLVNIWQARLRFLTGTLESWREGTFQHDLQDYYELENVLPSNNNELKYKNLVSLPLLIFGQPFIQNDVPILDHAGSTLIFARNYIELWLINRREPDALFPDSDMVNSIYNSFPKKSKLKKDSTLCLTPGRLSVDKAGQSSEHSFIATTLAYHVALEIIRNEDAYSSVRDRKTGKVARNIEFVYNKDGTRDLIDRNASNGGEVMNIFAERKYEPYAKKNLKLKYTKLPGSEIEKYSEKQLFFLTSVRHLCNVVNTANANSNSYMENLHTSLSHLKEFSEAWKCRVGSRLNSPNKCFRGTMFG